MVFKDLKNQQGVGNTPSLPFISLIVNCHYWMQYGLALSEPTMVIPNGIGCLLGLLYAYKFWNALKPSEELPRKKFRKQSQGAMFLVVLGCFLYMQKFDALLGWMTCLATMALNASTADKFPLVWKTKDVSHLGSKSMAFASWACSAVWFVLGYIYMEKAAVWVPNIQGVVFSGISIFLFTSCGAVGSSKKNDGENDEKTKLVGSKDSSKKVGDDVDESSTADSKNTKAVDSKSSKKED